MSYPPDDSREFNPYGGPLPTEPAPLPSTPPPPGPPPAWGGEGRVGADPYGGAYGQPAPRSLDDSRFGVAFPTPQAPALDVPAVGTVQFQGIGRLAEAFGAVFALILQLRTTAPQGDPEVLRERTKRLLQEAAASALQQGAAPDDVDAATFALVSFFDEAVLLADWPGREAWMSRPLQLELYDRFDAGEQFYVRLNALLDDPSRTEVLEVYYLAMALGFKGQYQIRGQDELRRLVGRAQERLAKAPGLVPGPLAPHGVPVRTAVAEVGQAVPAWMWFAGALLLALLVYVGFSIYTSSVAGDVVGALEALTARP